MTRTSVGEYESGVQTREVRCIRDGEQLAREECERLLPGNRLSRPCNSSPCDIVRYEPSAWGECSCETSRRERNVTCRGIDGEERDEILCQALGLERQRTTRRCIPEDCGRSSRKLLQLPEIGECDNMTNCSNRGECNNGRCNCHEGFEGDDCQIDMRGAEGSCELPSLLDTRGECCQSGIFDLKDHKCCDGENDEVQLDGNGECCRGSLDMCGQCNGSSVLDALGRCCQVRNCSI